MRRRKRRGFPFAARSPEPADAHPSRDDMSPVPERSVEGGGRLLQIPRTPIQRIVDLVAEVHLGRR
jgi:hypothetical protein